MVTIEDIISFLPIIGALIGAIIGSIGATLLSHRLKKVTERERAQSNLVKRYLLLLQDSVEKGLVITGVIKKDRIHKKFVPFMIYSFGKILAYEQILMLDGVYVEMEQVRTGSGKYLSDSLEMTKDDLRNFFPREIGINFELIGEFLIERRDDYSHQVITYGHFLNAIHNMEKQENWFLKETFEPILNNIQNFDFREQEHQHRKLMLLLDFLEEHTGFSRGFSRNKGITGNTV